MRRTAPNRMAALALIAWVVGVMVIGGGILIAASMGASAQEVPTGGNSTGASTPTAPNGERIDNSTELVNASYDNSTGMATVTLKSETIQEITLTDAGGFESGGVVNQRTVTLAPGETATISLDVTRGNDGFVGVTVGTDDVLYAVPIQQGQSESDDATNPFARTPATAGWFGGAAAVMVMAALAAWHVKRDKLEAPEPME